MTERDLPLASGAAVLLPLAPLLSLLGGYVDTAGFLALQGLFTAHVTGNFVTLGASLVLGTSGVLAKLMALPLFCLVVFWTRRLSNWIDSHGFPALRSLLILMMLLLVVGSVLAIAFGPFRNPDAWPAVATGMVLVAAMAIQNAAHRMHLTSAPPSTLMTGTTTQIMIDLADLSGRRATAREKAGVRLRLARLTLAAALFAAGCAAAALLYAAVNVWCFAVPPALGLLAVFASRPEREAS